jgi:Transmembrane family 220, helix
MRYVSGMLCVILVAFAVLQYDDPDGPLWAAIYLLAAFWPGLAALRPAAFAIRPALRYGAWASVALFALGCAWLAPTIGADWIHVEEAREAIGFAICAAAVLVAIWSARRPAALAA